jgi:outer membrane immunogenic protein
MRRTFVGSIAALALASASSVALAADIPPPEPVMSWTGFYLGGGGGIGWADVDINSRRCARFLDAYDAVDECDPEFDFRREFEESGDGEFVGIVQGGFDWELAPSFVVGVMASWEFADIANERDFDDDSIDDELFRGRHRFESSLDGILTVAGRAGFAPTQNLLVYGLFGWSWADLENNWRFRVEEADLADDLDFNRGDTFSANGFTFGGGAEWRFTENVSFRAEYRFTDFDNFEDNGRDRFENLDVEFRRNLDVDVDVQRVLFTINWRFGGFGAATAAAY